VYIKQNKVFQRYLRGEVGNIGIMPRVYANPQFISIIS
jgi:hypothetical protein